MQVLAILQARTTSTRLPGKVLRKILGSPMLELQLERMHHARCVDRIVVATSEHASDDDIANLCGTVGVACFRGSLDDVLDRYYQAAAQYNARHVVRMTADCPVADPRIMDAAVMLHLKEENDYTRTGVTAGWPDGLDVEIIRHGVLQATWMEAHTPGEREHVTVFIKNHPERFRIGHLASPVDYSGQRWTVDTPEDFSFITRIYENLYPNHPQFGMEDILNLLRQHPGLARINT